MCVCVREREREIGREGERDREGGRERELIVSMGFYGELTSEFPDGSQLISFVGQQ